MTTCPHTVNEIVWHFAGYIHIADELARSRELYDGSARHSLHDDFAGKRIVDARMGGGLEDFLSTRQRGVATPERPKGSLDVEEQEAGTVSSADDPVASALAAAPARVKELLAGGGGGFEFPEPFFKFAARVPREFAPPPDVEITVTYHDGAAQRVIHSSQIKAISSNNGAYVDTNTTDAAKARLHELHETHTGDIAATLDEMFEKAEAKIDEKLPEDLQLPEHLNAQALMGFAKALGDERKAEAEADEAADASATDAPARIEPGPDASLKGIHAKAHGQEAGDGEEPLAPGLYIDGERQDDGTEHPEAVVPERPEEVFKPDGPVTTIPVVGVKSEMGWNAAYNSAQIFDLNEAVQTLVVKGDYFETNAIVQTNAYKDNDEVDIAGLPKEKKSITEANDSSNVAEFIREAAFDVLPVGRFHAGLTWKVDVLDGDFVDVKTINQYNWIYDNDIGVVTTQGVYSRLLAGGNEGNGFATIVDFGKYDVIIVLGDYHEANFIYQKNFLIDDDTLKAASALDEDFDGDLTQLASWSANTLLNDATIDNIGVQDFEIMGDGLRDLVDAIGRGEVTFDPEVGWHLTGNGTGTLDILYVTGDYYDINVIQQTNVVADLDTAIQLLPDIAVGEGTEIKQIVSTGENATINTATIIDVGATFHAYLEGEYYEDSILVQAEIVMGDDDDVDHQDTDALVSEVIAFIGSPDEEDSPPPAPLQDPGQQGDVLNIMS